MTIDEKIAHLEGLLLSGANSITIDGVTTSLNIESIRQQLRELKRQKSGRSQVRQVIFTSGYDGY